jgi:S1-C subfamily serine protease
MGMKPIEIVWTINVGHQHQIILKRTAGHFTDTLSLLVDGQQILSAPAGGFSSNRGRHQFKLDEHQLELRWIWGSMTGDPEVLVLMDGETTLASSGTPEGIARAANSKFRTRPTAITDLQAAGIVSAVILAIWGVSIGLHFYVWRWVAGILFLIAPVVATLFLVTETRFRRVVCWSPLLALMLAFWFSPFNNIISTRLSPMAAPLSEQIISFRRDRANLQSLFVVALDKEAPTKGSGTGSAVVIRRAGNVCFVLTAKHVIEGFHSSRLPILVLDKHWKGDLAQLTELFKDKDKTDIFSPIIYRHPTQDWAVLVMRDPKGEAVAAPIASHPLRENDWVLAIGNPHGEPFHDHGRVVGFRSDQGLELPLHSAVIAPGSSGGPLYDRDFCLAGINIAQARQTAISREQSVAVPISVLQGLTFAAVGVSAVTGATINGTWTDLGAIVAPGESIHASAIGSWIVDSNIFRTWGCDAGGMSEKGNEYIKERLFKEYPLGALLIGVRQPGKGEPTILGTFDDARRETFVLDQGQGGIRITSIKSHVGGQLMARINDGENGNGANKGQIDLAVMVVK